MESQREQEGHFMLLQTTSFHVSKRSYHIIAPAHQFKLAQRKKTRSILLRNWSFPGEALVCKTYFQNGVFLNKQGFKRQTYIWAAGGSEAGIDWVGPSRKWTDYRQGNTLHQLLVSYLRYVRTKAYTLRSSK